MYRHQVGCAQPFTTVAGMRPGMTPFPMAVRMGAGDPANPTLWEKTSAWLEKPNGVLASVAPTHPIANKWIAGAAIAGAAYYFYSR